MCFGQSSLPTDAEVSSVCSLSTGDTVRTKEVMVVRMTTVLVVQLEAFPQHRLEASFSFFIPLST